MCIRDRERNRVLRGTKQPNGKYEYESPVSYWMPFNKGIGLHDASWRSTFGRDIYINSGSHGCINLPTGFAGSLYSQIDVYKRQGEKEYENDRRWNSY